MCENCREEERLERERSWYREQEEKQKKEEKDEKIEEFRLLLATLNENVKFIADYIKREEKQK